MKTLYLILVLIGFNIGYTQEIKDTLFFYLDTKYIKEYEYDKGIYYIQEDTLASSGYDDLVFYKKEIRTQLKYDRILSLKEFVKKSNYYDSNREKNKLHDLDLADHLANYTIFLVDEKCGTKIFIEVEPGVVIE